MSGSFPGDPETRFLHGEALTVHLCPFWSCLPGLHRGLGLLTVSSSDGDIEGCPCYGLQRNGTVQ